MSETIMKTKLYFLIVLSLAIIITLMAFQVRQDHKTLFEKAKYCMETKGDLKEAITLFDSLIRTYPNQREYAANAQFHIGLCYEKLGNQAAQKAYQDVITNYGDQKELVKVARQRLSQLTQMAEEIENAGIESVKIRSALTCESERGVCAKCYGMNLATGNLVGFHLFFS